MWIGKKKLGRNLDGRYKLTDEEDALLMGEILEGKLKDGELGLKYGVSRTKVYFMRYPEKKKKKMDDARKYQKENKRDNAYRNEANKKLLLKKKALRDKDML